MTQLDNFSQAQRERLFHIDIRLYFLGSVNRADIVARFGLKEAAASHDFALYKELASKNIEYDIKAKTYIQREGFTPLFEYSGSQTLAALLHGFGDDFVGTDEYDMQSVKEDGKDGVMLAVQVRAALASYVLRRWNVDCSKEPNQKTSLDGPENHLWLKNQQTLYGVDNLAIAPGYNTPSI